MFGVRVDSNRRYMKQTDLENSFQASFSEYGDAVYRFCLVKVSNNELAEDMTQEVFMRYWQYLKDGKEMTNTRSFLYTIANNLAKDWYKKKKEVSLDDRLDNNLVPEDGQVDPETTASYVEVLSVIEELEDSDREVLILTYVEGLPPKDIAEILGDTANAVSVRLNRATKRLQQKLKIWVKTNKQKNI